MTDKSMEPEMVAAVEGLSLQMEIAQRLILALQEKHGNVEAIRMVNESIQELDPEHGKLLALLVTAMQAEAMGDAGPNVH